MPRDLEAITRDLNTLRAEDFDDRRSPMTGPERLNALCDEVLLLPNPPSAFPQLFRLMERLSESELGTPGPLVHTMEKHIGAYEDLLAESISRKPTDLSIWMVNRILNGKIREKERWKALLASASVHPLASDVVRREAQRFLEIQKRK
jgi:hypothetical protein